LTTTARDARRNKRECRGCTEQKQRTPSIACRRHPAACFGFAGNQRTRAASRPKGVSPQRRTNDL
jgi:hypothetical protein